MEEKYVGKEVNLGCFTHIAIFFVALCFLGNSIMYEYTWFNAWEALKTLGISLGISALVFIIIFISHKWLEE